MGVVPVASVIICTHNRADYIGRCLQAVAAQEVDFPYEVLVIDNASTDGTAQVAEKFLSALPLKIVHEPKLGLSEARNRGITEATSDILIYIDDDAVAQPGWLKEMVRCFTTIQPRPASVGGRILLDWNGPPLSWVAERYLGIFGLVDLSTRLTRLDADGAPDGLFIGCNMAFSREALESVGRFSPKLGYKGGNLLGGEETAILHQLIERRQGVYYSPDAVVRHIVVPERRTRSYYAKRMLSQGKANIAIDTEAGRLRSGQIPRRFVREAAGLLRASLRFGAHSLRLNFRDAEFAGWESVQRTGRLIRLIEQSMNAV